jgi:hypothetical protein
MDKSKNKKTSCRRDTIVEMKEEMEKSDQGMQQFWEF